jgi:hypothetical protein
LKSRVRAIALGLLSLALFILSPEVLGGLDILALALLGAATEQDDEGISVLAEIDTRGLTEDKLTEILGDEG